MSSPRLLYASIDSSEIDRGPDENNRPYVALFYFLYIIVIAFFIVNIFVGFVVVTFQSESQHSVFSKNQVSISRSRDSLEKQIKCSASAWSLCWKQNRSQEWNQRTDSRRRWSDTWSWWWYETWSIIIGHCLVNICFSFGSLFLLPSVSSLFWERSSSTLSPLQSNITTSQRCTINRVWNTWQQLNVFATIHPKLPFQQLLTNLLDILNIFFTTFFTLEFLLKIGAYGVRVRMICTVEQPVLCPGLFSGPLEFLWFPDRGRLPCRYYHESNPGELDIST